MTPEQLAALKEVAERAKEESVSHLVYYTFREKFTPTTCLALLEEVERQMREIVELRQRIESIRRDEAPRWVY